MKKATKIISTLVLTVLTLASCLNTEELKTSPECVIRSFSIGDITTSIRQKNAAGNDTVVKRVLSGSSILFNIDQINGKITSVDSIPQWVDLTRVVPKFEVLGTATCKLGDDDTYYKMTSGADSINFEKPVDIMVIATNGISFKNYTVYINKSKTNNDSLNWVKRNNDFSVKGDFKAVALDNHVYTFYEDGDGCVEMTSASTVNNLASWTTPVKMEGADIVYQSVVLFHDEFYAIDADGYICKAQNSSRPNVWNKISDKTFDRLIAADKYYIYAVCDGEMVGSKDLETWTPYGKKDMNMLPTSHVNYHSYQSNTNSNIQISMLSGISENNNENSVTWYKVSSLDENINQDWMYIQVTKDNEYGLPKFEDMSVAMHNGALYAIGSENNGGNATYKYIYRSTDNGITWHTNPSKYPLPEGLDAKKGSACMISSNDNIWIIQKGGNIWSGVIK